MVTDFLQLAWTFQNLYFHWTLITCNCNCNCIFRVGNIVLLFVVLFFRPAMKDVAKGAGRPSFLGFFFFFFFFFRNQMIVGK